MAQVPNHVLEIIDRFLKTLRENNIPIRKAILFGSYAKGQYREWSDIDLALVSDIFEGVRFYDKDKIRKYKLAISSDLQVLPYKPSHFTPDDPFVKEILETGIEIV